MKTQSCSNESNVHFIQVLYKIMQKRNNTKDKLISITYVTRYHYSADKAKNKKLQTAYSICLVITTSRQSRLPLAKISGSLVPPHYLSFSAHKRKDLSSI